MADLFVMLDVTWADNRKILQAGMDGRGLHATILCLAKRLNTDGWVDRILLRREGATDELIDRLVSLKLLEVEGDMVRPWDWHERNPTQEELSSARSVKARRANHKRWRHVGRFEKCEICNPPDAEVSSTVPVIPKDPSGITEESSKSQWELQGSSRSPCNSSTSLYTERERKRESYTESETKTDVDAEAIKKAAATAEKIAASPDVEKLLARFELEQQRQALTVFLSDERIVDRLYVWGPELSGYLDGLNTPLGKAASHSDVVATATEVLTVRSPITPKLLRIWLARTMRGDPSGGSGDRKADGSFKTPGDRMRDRMRLTS